jgi:hypothetical protein
MYLNSTEHGSEFVMGTMYNVAVVKKRNKNNHSDGLIIEKIIQKNE